MLSISPKKISYVLAALAMISVTSVTQVAAQETKVAPAFSFGAQGPHFFSGESVTLTENLVGDVYVASGQVTIDGTIDGDLLVAGGQVIINGTVTEDVRAAGGSLDIRGTLGDDATLAGGNIRLEPTARVAGSVVAAGGNIELLGTVAGPVWVGGSQTTLAGQFGSDVTLRGEQASVAANASISGNLQTTLDQEPRVATGATVVGKLLASPSAQPDHQVSTEPKSAGQKIASAVMSLLIALIIGSLLLALAPKTADRLAGELQVAPIAALGWGFVHLVLTPAVLGLILITIVGIPFSLVGFILYFLSMILGGWITAYVLGRKVLALENRTATFVQRAMALAAGLAILKVISFVPVAGAVVQFVAMLLGMGALVLGFKNRGKLNPAEGTASAEKVSGKVTIPTKPITKKVTPRKMGTRRGRSQK